MKSKFCKYCNRRTAHIKQRAMGDGMGCLLTIITGGLFLLLWIPIMMWDWIRPYHCQTCGK